MGVDSVDDYMLHYLHLIYYIKGKCLVVYKRIHYPINEGSNLQEVTRWEIINAGKTKSPDRFEKKRNYSPKDFKNVNFEDMFINDRFTWQTRVHGESNYLVTVSFEGAFEYLKYKLASMRGKNRWKRITIDMVREALSKSLDTEDLYVECSCPDFTYRFAYWATQADCKYGVPQNVAPTVRNVRNNKGYVCKHLLAILYGKRWVQSAAKSWLAYMRANPELTEYYIWGKDYEEDILDDEEDDIEEDED